jgi:hypothetical protein
MSAMIHNSFTPQTETDDADLSPELFALYLTLASLGTVLPGEIGEEVLLGFAQRQRRSAERERRDAIEALIRAYQQGDASFRQGVQATFRALCGASLSEVLQDRAADGVNR